MSQTRYHYNPYISSEDEIDHNFVSNVRSSTSAPKYYLQTRSKHVFQPEKFELALFKLPSYVEIAHCWRSCSESGRQSVTSDDWYAWMAGLSAADRSRLKTVLSDSTEQSYWRVISAFVEQIKPTMLATLHKQKNWQLVHASLQWTLRALNNQERLIGSQSHGLVGRTYAPRA